MNKNNADFGIYRVAAVSPELRIANPEFNSEVICEIIKNNNADLFVFPELCITGYSCQDLFFQNTLLENVNKAIAKICEISLINFKTLVVGAPLVSDSRLFNTAIVISNGKILGVVPKTYLCNYNEYYEERWFASEFDRISDTININGVTIPFGTDLIFESEKDCNFKLGIEICEDLWSPLPPSTEAALNGATVIANLSASNEYLGKAKYREDNVRMHSGRIFSAYIYSASGVWESTSDIVFSGKSMICENGALLITSKPYSLKSEICFADIDVQRLQNDRLKNKTFSRTKSSKKFRIIQLPMETGDYPEILQKIDKTPFVPQDLKYRNDVCSEITEIQSSALSRRMLHTGSKNAVIGISGGLDSTLALLAIYYSFKKINLDFSGIIAVSMPGFGTTERTKTNGLQLAKNLGMTVKEISIEAAVKLHFKDIGHNEKVHDTVYENAQARQRTYILMDIANQFNGLVIGTGDLSESALGWCTFNGDHISMYGLNCGIPKTLVKYIIEWYSQEIFMGDISKILKDIINTPISPELLPPDDKGNILQMTEDSIGPYILHDFFLYYSVRHSFSPEKILFLAEKVFSEDYSNEFISKTLKTFYKRFFNNQFKRNAVPDGPKIGTVSLSPRSDWRMPSDADSSDWLI